MTAPVRSLRLLGQHTEFLDRNSFLQGEFFYDQDDKTLRVMDGRTVGGTTIATRLWIQENLTTLERPIAYTNTTQSTGIGNGSIVTAGGVGIAKNVNIGQLLNVAGDTTLASNLILTGNFTLNTNKFTVASSTGNTSVAGTLSVTGNTSITGNLAVNSNKFTVNAGNGNTVSAGTLQVASDFSVNTNKFTVAASTGNTELAGTLHVVGATTLSSTLAVAENFTVATNKFTVDKTTGNTLVAGTLNVTGTSTSAGVIVNDLTPGRITYAGTSGRLKDSTELTWDESELYVNGNQHVTGNLTVDGNFTLGGTSITLGDSNTDSITITADLTSNIVPNATATYELGTSAKRWNKLWTNSLDVSGAVEIGGDFALATDKLTVNASTGATIHNGPVTINGTFTVNGPTVNSTTTNVATSSSVIEIHTSETPLAADDGKDLGVVINYFKSVSAKKAVLVWKNNNGELTYYNDATDTNGSFSGTLGTIKALSLATSSTGSIRAEGTGGVTTTQTTFPLVNATATTINFGGAATSMNIGSTSGTATIKNPTVVGTETTVNLWNTTSTTVNFAGASTATAIGAATGTTTIGNDLVTTGDLQVRGGDITTNQTTFNLVNTTATTVNFAGAATSLNIGNASGTTNLVGTVAVTSPSITTSLVTPSTTFNLLNATATTINFGSAATTLNIGATGGTTTIASAVTVSGALTESSSIALKENINPIVGALDLIKQLEGVTYDRKNGTAKKEAGLIAEAVDKVLPNIVKHDQAGNPEGINYTKLTAYLIEAVKELTARVDQLSSK